MPTFVPTAVPKKLPNTQTPVNQVLKSKTFIYNRKRHKKNPFILKGSIFILKN